MARVELDEKPAARDATARDGTRAERAVVRLRTTARLTPQALLEAAEGVRRALRVVGITDVHIDVEPEDAGSD